MFVILKYDKRNILIISVIVGYALFSNQQNVKVPVLQSRLNITSIYSVLNKQINLDNRYILKPNS